MVPSTVAAGEVAKRGLPVTAARAELRLPSAARLVLDDETEVDVEVLVGAPVPLGNRLVLQRALCRYAFGDATAHGWAPVGNELGELVEPGRN